MLQLFYCSNELGCCRFGISVSRRFGRAVQRNLLKRCIREGIRRNKALWPVGWDVVVHPRPLANINDCGQVAAELKDLLKSLGTRKEIGILKKDHPI